MRTRVRRLRHPMHSAMSTTALKRSARRYLWLAACCLGGSLPVQQASGQSVNTSVIKLSYRCGNWFRIRSANATDVTLQYAVYRTSETGTFVAPSTPTGATYSETWIQTQHRGAVLITYNGARVAEKANGNAPCATVASVGQWSDTISWPIMPIHAHLLPNGQVLTYGRAEAIAQGYTIPPGRSVGIPFIWNPANPTAPQTPVIPLAGTDTADFFCSGHAFLPDGRLMEVGGAVVTDNRGQRFAWTFNWQTNAWTQEANMADGRWYPTLVTMSNGQAYVVSGTDTNSAIDSIPEVYNPAANTWTEMTGVTAPLPYWVWLLAAPNGQLFTPGDSNVTYYINTNGTGSFGSPIYTNYGLGRDYGSAIMYDTGKVLIVGGGNTTATAEIIDLNQASPSWQYTGSMHQARRQMNAVLLANGQVMASGGSAGPGFNPATNISYTPEIWNPATGVWTQMANYMMPRLYHSETLLLTDGRVLSSGGGQPAATGLTDNFNAEIYSPTYLFNPDGSSVTTSRPVITAAPATTTYGGTIQLTVQNVAAGTAKVLWIRLGSVTHAMNLNQRLNYLPSTQTGQSMSATAPSGANLAPPGHYLLFVLNANGIPSIGTIIQIQ
jgi:galactose oxidase